LARRRSRRRPSVSDAVAVTGDAGDHAFNQAGRARRLQRTETQRIQQRDRPRAHREDIANDAADTGRRTLVRLDERRMIVRFDLEDGGQAVADIDRAGVFPRSLENLRPAGRQGSKMDA